MMSICDPPSTNAIVVCRLHLAVTQIRSSGRLFRAVAATSRVARRRPWHFLAGSSRLMSACLVVSLRCRIVLSDCLVVWCCATSWCINVPRSTSSQAGSFLLRPARFCCGVKGFRAPRRALSRFPSSPGVSRHPLPHLGLQRRLIGFRGAIGLPIARPSLIFSISYWGIASRPTVSAPRTSSAFRLRK